MEMVVDDMIGSDISKQLEPDLKNKQIVEYSYIGICTSWIVLN